MSNFCQFFFGESGAAYGINRDSRKVRRSRVRHFALAVDPFETPETVKNVHLLIMTMRLPFPVGGATRELANDSHYKGVPATIVLDCEANIAGIFLAFTRRKGSSLL